MTVQQATQHLLFQLYHLYDTREAGNIAGMVMEEVTQWKKIDRIINKTATLSPAKQELLLGYLNRLLQHEPVQYVLQHAWFCGMKLSVNEHVLIPRPETEELVQWIAEDVKSVQTAPEPIRITDVGTGSGCIAIALHKMLPGASVCGCDISAAALEVAGENAAAQGAVIELIRCDFLHASERGLLPAADVIVSNPPYIPQSDMLSMPGNVVRFEPHTALFVSDTQPLAFYAALADFAATHLSASGAVYAETHEDYGPQVEALFHNHGFADVILRKDLQEKYRMVKASGKK